MGLLDNVVNSAVRQPRGKPGLGQTVAAGVILALLVKAIRQHQNAQAGAASAPQAQVPQPGQPKGGGLLGGLGGMFGSGGLSGILSGLGGAGALGGLLGQLKQRGLADQANSWVSTGANQQVQPDQIEQALGEDAMRDLEQQTGLPRDQLRKELAQHLPEAINEATPQGRLPDEHELHQIVTQPPTTH
ncbi:MAG TPA: YidB family protein [Caulobacteraceae bacterium]|jgi:uncharacterized protein YidB (DUF937 family)|nr:YidB family protein [Caulobacteraceae bacterium]